MTPLAASSSLTHTQCAFVLRPCRRRPCLVLNIANVIGQGTSLRRKFFWSMMAAAAVALLVGGVVAAVLTNRQTRRDDIEELSRQAEAIGRQAEESISNARQRGDAALRNLLNERTVRQLLFFATQVGGHDFVEIAAVRRGELIVPDTSVLIPALGLEEHDFRPGTTAEFEGEVDGQPVVGVVRTLDTGTPAFSFAVLLGRESFLIVGTTLFRAFVVALGVAVIVVAVLAGLLAKRLGNRLGKVSAAAGRLADGDLTTRVSDDGDDEVAELADRFNEMADRLEAAAQRERDFLLNVGHELRTPLTSLAGYAETLADGTVEPDELPKVAAVLERQTSRLSRLVEDLMLLSRLQAREFTLRPEDVELDAHVKGVVGDFQERAVAASVRLEIETEPTGPVAVDPVRIAQIVSNLVENGLRYTPEGGAVLVRVSSSPSHVAIEVKDTGPGIDAEDLPRVFDRLYVAQHYRAVRPEGSGLGLSIVRELVTAMGGEVAVESEPGQGTSVMVRLPRAS